MDEEIFGETNDRIQRALNESKKREIEEKFDAQFGETSKDLPPEIESQWLHNIEEFERQHEDAKMVTVREFVGNPGFTPLSEVPPAKLSEEIDKVLDYLSEHNVNVDFLEDVTEEEAYRFLTEELMSHETGDLHIEGWTTNYIYEEFHPNLKLDAKDSAEHFLWHLFERELDHAVQDFSEDEMYDSNSSKITRDELKSRIEKFYSRFATFPSSKHTVIDCEVTSEETATVHLNSEWSGLLVGTMEQQSFSGISVMKMKRSPYGGCDVVQANIVGVEL